MLNIHFYWCPHFVAALRTLDLNSHALAKWVIRHYNILLIDHEPGIDPATHHGGKPDKVRCIA